MWYEMTHDDENYIIFYFFQKEETCISLYRNKEIFAWWNYLYTDLLQNLPYFWNKEQLCSYKWRNYMAMANFDALCEVISSRINIWFMKSDICVLWTLDISISHKNISFSYSAFCHYNNSEEFQILILMNHIIELIS